MLVAMDGYDTTAGDSLPQPRSQAGKQARFAQAMIATSIDATKLYTLVSMSYISEDALSRLFQWSTSPHDDRPYT